MSSIGQKRVGNQNHPCTCTLSLEVVRGVLPVTQLSSSGLETSQVASFDKESVACIHPMTVEPTEVSLTWLIVAAPTYIVLMYEYMGSATLSQT